MLSSGPSYLLLYGPIDFISPYSLFLQRPAPLHRSSGQCLDLLASCPDFVLPSAFGFRALGPGDDEHP